MTGVEPHLLLDYQKATTKCACREGDFTTSLFCRPLNYTFHAATHFRVGAAELVGSSFSGQRATALHLSTNSDLFVIYNQSTGAGLERPTYSFQIS